MTKSRPNVARKATYIPARAPRKALATTHGVAKPISPSLRGWQTHAGSWMKDPYVPEALEVASMLVGPDTDVVHIGGDTINACYGFVLIWLVKSQSVSKETRFVFHIGSNVIYSRVRVVCEKVRKNKICNTLNIRYTAFDFPDEVIEIAKAQEQLKHVDFRPRTSIVLSDSECESSDSSEGIEGLLDGYHFENDGYRQEILDQLEGRAEPGARTIRHFPHLFEEEEPQISEPIQKIRKASRQRVGKVGKRPSSKRK